MVCIDVSSMAGQGRTKSVTFYWFIFLGVSLVALMPAQSQSGGVIFPREVLLQIIFLVLFLSIGLRFGVGGDWVQYQILNNQFIGTPIQYITRIDPGYGLLNWIGANWFGGIFLTNFAIAGIFIYGLHRFCWSLPNPAIALLTALPYLVLVVSQGYTRQAAAIGVFLCALSYLGSGGFFRYIFLSCVSASFHKTAIILLPFSIFMASHKSIIKILTFIITTVFLMLTFYDFFLSDSVNTVAIMVKRYFFEIKPNSSGAFTRLFLVAICSTVYLLFRKRLNIPDVERRFWTFFSLAGLTLFGMYFLSSSSAVIDRMGLYWLPLQVYLFSHLPTIFSKRDGNSRNLVIIGLVIFAIAVQWVWLFYADSAFCWLPYRFYPWELFWGINPSVAC